jgi:hypothetical protein
VSRPSGEKHGDRSPAKNLDSSGSEPLITAVISARGAIQELIEATQVRERHVDLLRRCQLRGPTWLLMRPRLTCGESAGTLDHSFGTNQVLAAASLDRLPYVVQRMIGQQLLAAARS